MIEIWPRSVIFGWWIMLFTVSVVFLAFTLSEITKIFLNNLFFYLDNIPEIYFNNFLKSLRKLKICNRVNTFVHFVCFGTYTVLDIS